MAVSEVVRRYYAERIFAQSTRESAPPNFRPLEIERTGRATVEGCRGGGKNILEVFLAGVGDEDGRIDDLRMGCGLCNPAMYAAADLVADWGRGRAFAEVLALDPLADGVLDPLFEVLGGRAPDAEEKLRYALLALQHAVLDHLGRPLPPLPRIPDPLADDEAADDEY